jgi:ubiquinone/menaquinone biosynthesis C-methylase UbiE
MDEAETDRLDQSVLSAHALKNRAMWEKTSDEYEERNAAALSGDHAMAWGLWRIPETELQVLGDVAGLDVLELGCGAARWSIALAGHGARPVGLDLSPRQLAHARHLMTEAGMDFPLVEASAEAVPLADAGFDIVFCDWGAMSFCDPYRTVPEAARLLRPGGLLAFATGTPLAAVCDDAVEERIHRQLVHDYFGMREFAWGEQVVFQLPYGEWICLFRRNGLLVEDLLETQPVEGMGSTYLNEEQTAWARRWPMENIWRVRKERRR